MAATTLQLSKNSGIGGVLIAGSEPTSLFSDRRVGERLRKSDGAPGGVIYTPESRGDITLKGRFASGKLALIQIGQNSVLTSEYWARTANDEYIFLGGGISEITARRNAALIFESPYNLITASDLFLLGGTSKKAPPRSQSFTLNLGGSIDAIIEPDPLFKPTNIGASISNWSAEQKINYFLGAVRDRIPGAAYPVFVELAKSLPVMVGVIGSLAWASTVPSLQLPALLIGTGIGAWFLGTFGWKISQEILTALVYIMNAKTTGDLDKAGNSVAVVLAESVGFAVGWYLGGKIHSGFTKYFDKRSAGGLAVVDGRVKFNGTVGQFEGALAMRLWVAAKEGKYTFPDWCNTEALRTRFVYEVAREAIGTMLGGKRLDPKSILTTAQKALLMQYINQWESLCGQIFNRKAANGNSGNPQLPPSQPQVPPGETPPPRIPPSTPTLPSGSTPLVTKLAGEQISLTDGMVIRAASGSKDRLPNGVDLLSAQQFNGALRNMVANSLNGNYKKLFDTTWPDLVIWEANQLWPGAHIQRVGGAVKLYFPNPKGGWLTSTVTLKPDGHPNVPTEITKGPWVPRRPGDEPPAASQPITPKNPYPGSGPGADALPGTPRSPAAARPTEIIGQGSVVTLVKEQNGAAIALLERILVLDHNLSKDVGRTRVGFASVLRGNPFENSGAVGVPLRVTRYNGAVVIAVPDGKGGWVGTSINIFGTAQKPTGLNLNGPIKTYLDGLKKPSSITPSNNPSTPGAQSPFNFGYDFPGSAIKKPTTNNQTGPLTATQARTIVRSFLTQAGASTSGDQAKFEAKLFQATDWFLARASLNPTNLGNEVALVNYLKQLKKNGIYDAIIYLTFAGKALPAFGITAAQLQEYSNRAKSVTTPQNQPSSPNPSDQNPSNTLPPFNRTAVLAASVAELKKLISSPSSTAVEREIQKYFEKIGGSFDQQRIDQYRQGQISREQALGGLSGEARGRVSNALDQIDRMRVGTGTGGAPSLSYDPSKVADAIIEHVARYGKDLGINLAFTRELKNVLERRIAALGNDDPAVNKLRQALAHLNQHEILLQTKTAKFDAAARAINSSKLDSLSRESLEFFYFALSGRVSSADLNPGQRADYQKAMDKLLNEMKSRGVVPRGAASIDPSTYSRAAGEQLNAEQLRRIDQMLNAGMSEFIIKANLQIGWRPGPIGIPQGKPTAADQKLSISSRTTPEIVRSRVLDPKVGKTLILVSQSSKAQYEKMFANQPNVVVVAAFNKDADPVNSLVEQGVMKGVRRIIGIGGAGQLDVAKGLTNHFDPNLVGDLVVVPTVTSTTTLATPFVVTGKDATVSVASAATEIVVPVTEMVNDILKMKDPELRKRAFQAFTLNFGGGGGDLQGSISMQLQNLYHGPRTGNTALKDLSKNRYSKDAIALNEKIANNFPDIAKNDANALNVLALDTTAPQLAARLADIVNQLFEYGNQAVAAGKNAKVHLNNVVGAEHEFFNATNGKDLGSKANHGELVAMGTLMQARAYGELRGDYSVYNSLVAAYQKLGIPTSAADLVKRGITVDMIAEALVTSVQKNRQVDRAGRGLGGDNRSLISEWNSAKGGKTNEAAQYKKLIDNTFR